MEDASPPTSTDARPGADAAGRAGERPEDAAPKAPAGEPSEGLSGRQATLLAMSMATAAGFTLCGYEILRTTANTLFVSAYGKDALAGIMALVPLGVTVVIYLYGRLLSLVGPQRTLLISTLLSALTMVVCYAGIHIGIKPARGILYVFKESYVVLIIEQYWSYINSMLQRDSAKRLNGPICGIASIGAISGGWLLSQLSGPWKTPSLLLLAAAVTLPAALLSDVAYRRFGQPRGSTAVKPQESAAPKTDHLGLGLFRKEPMLLLLIGVIASAQLIAGVLELSFKGMLQDQMPNPEQQNAFSGQFYAWLNGLAMVCQFVLAPLLLSLVPSRRIHIAIPLVHIGACIYLFMAPSLFRAGLAYLLFKSIDYSIFRATKELLYVPLSFDVRYRAKEIIDVFGYRVSKGVTSLAITVLQYAGVVFTVPMYALIGAAGAGTWLALVMPISRRDRDRRTAPSL